MMRSALLALALAGATVAGAQQAPQNRPGGPAPRRYTAEERRAAGEAVRLEMIKVYGEVENPVWRESASQVLGRLRYGTLDPNLELRPVIVGNPEINASAWPGGVVVINAGLLSWVDTLALVEEPSDSSRRQARARAYLGAVLAHEIAHITLFHTDRIIDAMRQQLQVALRDQPVRDPAVFEREGHLQLDTLVAFRRIRGQELAADSLGALYLLRAGGEIQNMMDLLRHLEASEGPGSALVATYLRSHPRGSTREAILEGLRARLKLNQGRLDDALALINTNTELRLAVALLDSVRRDFPTLLAAQHAQAAVFHRMWLNTVSVKSQQVRGSIYTYGARFLPAIRGAGVPGDTILYARARAGYRAVLARDSLPGAMSNLALLDAYGGRNAEAMRGAERAVAQSPDDTELLNNLGVVRFLSGDLRGARDAFRRTLTLQGSGEDPATVFNLGKTQAALQDPESRATLEGYLGFREESAWATEAATILGREHPAAGGSGTAQPAPMIQGVRLGMGVREVVQVLGPPAGREDGQRGQVFHYPALGLNVGVTVDGLVRFIALLNQDAGELDGIRVGTPLTAARERWGWPAQRNGGFLLFNRGSWLSGIDFGDPLGEVLRLYVISPK